MRSAKGATFKATEVSVFFGEPARWFPTHISRCGARARRMHPVRGCIVGCRHNAKNTLDKNYLYLAEKRGAYVYPETRVDRIDRSPAVSGREFSSNSVVRRRPPSVDRAERHPFGGVLGKNGRPPSSKPSTIAGCRRIAGAGARVRRQRGDRDGDIAPQGCGLHDGVASHPVSIRRASPNTAASLSARLRPDRTAVQAAYRWRPGMPRPLRFIANCIARTQDLLRSLNLRLGAKDDRPTRDAVSDNHHSAGPPATLVLAIFTAELCAF